MHALEFPVEIDINQQIHLQLPKPDEPKPNKNVHAETRRTRS